MDHPIFEFITPHQLDQLVVLLRLMHAQGGALHSDYFDVTLRFQKGRAARLIPSPSLDWPPEPKDAEK